MRLTEQHFLEDLISYTKVKQHEQDSSIKHIKTESVVNFAEGNKHAWEEMENLLSKRLTKIKELTE